MSKEKKPDAWRDRWYGNPWRFTPKESDVVYFAELWDQVSRDRHGRGRYYGTSPVEAAVINALDEGSSFNHP